MLHTPFHLLLQYKSWRCMAICKLQHHLLHKSHIAVKWWVIDMISVSHLLLYFVFTADWVGKGTEKTVETMSWDVTPHSVGNTRLQHPCNMQLPAYIIYQNMQLQLEGSIINHGFINSRMILHPYIWPGPCSILMWESEEVGHCMFQCIKDQILELAKESMLVVLL